MSQALLLLTYLTKDNTQIQVPTYMCIPMMSFVGDSPTFQSHHSPLAENCCFENVLSVWWTSSKWKDTVMVVSVCLSICVSVCLFVCFLNCMCPWLSVCFVTSLSLCLAICLLVCLHYLSICVVVCLSVCLSTSLPITPRSLPCFQGS